MISIQIFQTLPRHKTLEATSSQQIPIGIYAQQGFYQPQPKFEPHPNDATSGYQSTSLASKQRVTDTSIPEGSVKGFAFSDESTRRTFIRKVYSLFAVNKAI